GKEELVSYIGHVGLIELIVYSRMALKLIHNSNKNIQEFN
ncbi:8189_t:CDS:1, partial [Gigaspora margarita]